MASWASSLPGKTVDYNNGLLSMNYGLLSMNSALLSINSGLLSINYGLLSGVVAHHFGLLGVPGTHSTCIVAEPRLRGIKNVHIQICICVCVYMVRGGLLTRRHGTTYIYLLLREP